MNITVLAGGNSTERDVSLVSGKEVYKALKSKGHKVVLLDVYLGIDDVDVERVFEDERDWSEGIGKVAAVNPGLEDIRKLKGDDRDFFGKNVREICMKSDIVFLALHGANGEDGKIQASLDLMQVKYTGTDYLSSAICMDKAITKDFFIMNGISTPLAANINTKDEAAGAIAKIGFPMVVKAPNGGSSVGVFMVDNEDEAMDAINKCFELDNHVLIEQYIKGREFTCGVIDGKALPIVEIEPLEGFYDYKNKYQAGSTKETCPANLDEEATLRIQKSAEKAFKALHLKSYARIDYLLDENKKEYCLEANTIPGMTPTSLIPQEAAVIGYDFPSLCEWIIEISLKKYTK
ncbi:MAG: D-alanine--D-alanine ligase [Lachnospiraceae bacterium]|nr:D-alanine--D-alanine ligase [Lachnospiraceae bacterium]